MYGTNNHAAGAEILANKKIVRAIASHRKIISINAPPGLCHPKKIIDHKILSNNWIPKTINAILTPAVCIPFCQTSQAEIPINKYKVVQTGPNIQLGGLKDGLVIVLYQVLTLLLVKIAPKPPAPSVTMMEIISFKKFMIVLF